MSGDAEFAFSVLSAFQVTRPGSSVSCSPFLLRRLLAAAATGADEQNRQLITAVTGSYQPASGITAPAIRAATDIAVISGSELVPGYAPGIPDVHVHREADPRAAQETTRSWIREQTGLDIFVEFGPDEIGLISALAFSGTLQPAEGGHVTEAPFSRDSSTTVRQYIYSLEGTYRTGTDGQGRYVQLPFAEGGLFLTLYVPDRVTEDFGPLLAAAGEGRWRSALQALSAAGMTIRLPKEKFEMASGLNEEIVRCLNDRPVFSETASGESLSPQVIFQTIRCLYTATFLSDRAPSGDRPCTVDATRPFIWTIGDQNNSVLIAAGIYRGNGRN